MCTLTRGERFKDARTVYNQHGSQSMDDVYKATGVSASMIKDLEDDEKERSVGYDKIATLAKHYGVSSDFLLGLTDVCSTDLSVQDIHKKTGLTEKNIVSLMKRGPYGHEQPDFAESYEKMTNDLISYASTYAASRTYHRFLYNANFESPEPKREAGHNHAIVQYTVVAKVISGIPEDGVNYAKGYTAISPDEYAMFLLDEFSGDFKNYLRNIYFESSDIGGMDNGHH